MEGYLGASPDSQEQANNHEQAKRSLLLIFGEWTFGEPDEETRAMVQAASPERIEAWMKALNRFKSWAELVQTLYAPQTPDVP